MMAPRNFETARPQQATGPTSAAGKVTSSGNALVHGLASSKPVHPALPGEEDAFAQYCRSFVEALAPIGAIELALANDIAADRFRLVRARNLENALFAQIERENSEQPASASHAQAWVDPKKGLQRIALYANRIQRAIDKNTAALSALQTERKAAYAKAQEEAILLTQLAETEGRTYDPAPDFPSSESIGAFVYSAAEIARLVSYARRLEQAKIRFSPAPAAKQPVAM